MSDAVRLFDVKTLDQVCRVVPDLGQAMDSLWKTFGIGPWKINEIRPADLRDMVHMGKPACFGMSIGRAAAGAVEIEVIEPTEGDSTYSDFLKLHKEGGIHHLGWLLVNDFERALGSMEEYGFPCVTRARTYRSQFGYFDTVRVRGPCLRSHAGMSRFPSGLQTASGRRRWRRPDLDQVA